MLCQLVLHWSIQNKLIRHRDKNISYVFCTSHPKRGEYINPLTRINLHHQNSLSSRPHRPCNCRDKTSCLLNGSCQHKNLVYSCKVSTPDIKQNYSHYIGLTEHTFEDRLSKHKNSFMYESKRNWTELSNFIWGKKKEEINVDLDWSILDKAKPYLENKKMLQKMHVMS